ncbi:hypothetical protein LPJ63_002118 [Coemansia sp. RSA 2711]|nr:hypothetical protein LPJ63_002118 [Coemansia sp. RSA 2711]
MIPAEVLYQVPAIHYLAMDQNLRPFDANETGANSQPLTPLSGDPTQPHDYDFMQALSSATSIQQQQQQQQQHQQYQPQYQQYQPQPQYQQQYQPQHRQQQPMLFPQYDPRLQQVAAAHQTPHRRSFDLSALQIPASPVHISQQQSHQMQQTAPLFPTQAGRLPMHDSGLGIVGPGAHTVAKPSSQHSTQRPSSNRSSIGSISDNAALASPLQEPTALGAAGASDIALLLSGALQVKPNTSGKPPYPYATLITYAILQHPRKQMTLSEIYTWLMYFYPYFKTAGSGWKNSIRHNLSLNKMFMRIPRPINEPGKGAYWTVDLAMLDEALNARPKTATGHRYSPPGGMRHDGVVGQPTLTLTAPGPGQSSQLANPLMGGITSSISDKGLLAEMTDGSSSQPARRASLQSLPAHRYQPYSMPSQAGFGTMYSLQQGAAAAAAAAAVAQPLGSSGSSSLYNQTLPFAGGAQPAFPVPLSGAAAMSMAAGLAIPPSGLAGVPANSGGAGSAQPGNPTPAFPGSGADLQGGGPFSNSAGSVHVLPAASAVGRMAAPVSLRTHLQVRPTPSLPDHLLVSQCPGAHKERGSPSRSVQGDAMALSPALAASAADARAAAPYSQPGAPSIGDLSAYFAFVDSQDPSAQPDRSSDNA